MHMKIKLFPKDYLNVLEKYIEKRILKRLKDKYYTVT